MRDVLAGAARDLKYKALRREVALQHLEDGIPVAGHGRGVASGIFAHEVVISVCIAPTVEAYTQCGAS